MNRGTFGLLAIALVSLGCEPRAILREVGTPMTRDARPLVLLPRPCLVHRSVPDWHFGHRIPGPSPIATTLGVRHALDSLVETPAGSDGSRDGDECESPPELDFRPELADYRASDAALHVMRERGADSIVVLEVHTVMACAHANGSPLLAFYAAGREMDVASLVPRDVCLEDDITITALLFDRDGAARWALTRDVRPGDPVEHAVDSVLERVPATMPKRH